MGLKQILRDNYINISGCTTNRKIIVIESDDWGTIRMPSKKVYDTFLRKGIPVDRHPYCRNDTLASEDDLSALFEVLRSVRDQNGRNAILTANAVVVNPDFDKIKKSQYTKYYYELFSETLKGYGSTHQNSFELWKQGMEDNIFHPQSHGREHLNIFRWLKYLQQGNGNVVESFNYKMWGLGSALKQENQNKSLMAAFDADTKEELESMKSVIFDGLNLFEKIFGYKSESFIAPCYTWSNSFNSTFLENGIKILQGSRFQLYPLIDRIVKNGEHHKMGQKKRSLFYLVRNCTFEPTQTDYSSLVVDNCLKQIQSAFFWKKPAIISSHRLNYIGALNEDNRKQSLSLFAKLLSEIVKKWPDVEFMSSAELGKMIYSYK